MKHIRTSMLAFAMAAVMAAPLFSMTIKVGSIAPSGSPWDKALKKIAVEWKTISGGKIEMKIYPGGIVGNEPDMIRKMRIGQLQAAIFTGMGMSYIAPEVFSLSLPFLVRNDKELDYLMKRSTPYFEKLIAKKGFSVVVWSKAGWINFFSTKPVVYPRDLKPLKLSVAEGDAELLQAWRVMGYNAIPLATNDLMTALQNGMVEAFYAPPLVAASFQWFGIAKHMCGIQVAPLIGGIVISKKTWDEIPADIRPKLVKSARQIVDGLFAETTTLEKSAIDTMLKHGLKIHPVPGDGAKLWEKEAHKGWDAYVGKTFPEELLERLKGYLKEYREK
ncbi:MAG TPA: TRAP transporter substrate-binding protein DctP [Spirochaetota bacterium]|nr:TRAP transporter substrate-binding protein DctP [Spirochaetota bacterium]HPV41153.1 TRAP transporter substrate-binding protein DctP [Spirochaetota bacterium]